MKTLIFTIEAPCAFLNVNERPHYHLKAKLTKAWRQARITRNTPKNPGITRISWDNRNGPGGAGNTTRSLTHHLVLAERG